MAELEAILILDKHTLHGYLYSFIKIYKNLFSKIHIIIIGSDVDKTNYNAAEIIHIPYPVGISDISNMNDKGSKDYGNRIIDLLMLDEVIDEESRSIVFLHNCNHFYLPELLKERTKVNIVTYVDGFLWEGMTKSGVNNNRYLIHDKRGEAIFKASDKILYASKEVGLLITKHYNVSKNKLFKWTYGIKEPNRNNFLDSNIEALKKELLIDANEKVVVCYGGLFNDEDILLFVRAIESILISDQKIRVIMAGECDFLKFLKHCSFKTLGHIIFTGEIDEDRFIDLILIAAVVITLPKGKIKNNSYLNVLLHNRILITTKYAIPVEFCGSKLIKYVQVALKKRINDKHVKILSNHIFDGFNAIEDQDLYSESPKEDFFYNEKLSQFKFVLSDL